MGSSIQLRFSLAAYYGHTKEALRLLEKTGERVDPKAANNKGFTALMLAALGGHLHCVKALLEYSDAKYATPAGDTAMMLAENCGHVEIAAHIKQYILAQDEREEFSRLIATPPTAKQRSKSL